MIIRHLINRLATHGRGPNYRLFVPHLNPLLGQDLANIHNNVLARREEMVGMVNTAFREMQNGAHGNFNRYPVVLGYGSLPLPFGLDPGSLMCCALRNHAAGPSLLFSRNFGTTSVSFSGPLYDEPFGEEVDLTSLIQKPVTTIPMIPVRGSFPIPEYGLRDNDGFLFHQVTTRAMKPVHKERLESHGFRLRRRFAAMEDETLISNCVGILEDHGEYITARGWNMRILTGVGIGRGELWKEVRKFWQISNFWPRMGQGLVSRCGHSLQRRFSDWTDPYKDAPKRKLTEEEIGFIVARNKDKVTSWRIGELLRVSRNVVDGALSSYRKRKLFSKSERRCLWGVLTELYPHLFPSPGTFPDPDSKELDWTRVSQKMSRDRVSLRNGYREIYEELHVLQEGGLKFEDAFEKAVPHCEMLCASAFDQFIQIFLEVVPFSQGLDATAKNKRKVVHAMKERGVTGFFTERYPEYKHCRLLLGEIFAEVNVSCMHLSLQTRLHLLSHCLYRFANTADDDEAGKSDKWRKQVVEDFRREAELLPAEKQDFSRRWYW